MPDAVLQISPESEIRFKGPYTDVVVSEISLRNVSENRACFKVKTTAPKQYCVRPNCGLVEPGKTAVVTVMLQPFDYNGQEKAKHKFLVLSMPAPDVPVDSVDQLWKDPPTERVFEAKLRCVFDVTPETQQALKDTSRVQQPTVERRPSVSANAPPATPKQEVVVKPDDELLAEHKRLLEENNHLKEETQRLRKIMKNSSTSNYVSVNRPPDSNTISRFTVGIVAVVAILLGLILGKFII